MHSPKVRFPMQVFSTFAAVVFVALLAIATPASANVFVLCPNGADVYTEGTSSNVAGPLDGTCGPNSAINVTIPTETAYARLRFDSSVSGYPAGLTLGNLSGVDAEVAFSGQPGDQPFLMLAFTDPTHG